MDSLKHNLNGHVLVGFAAGISFPILCQYLYVYKPVKFVVDYSVGFMEVMMAMATGIIAVPLQLPWNLI
jgi:hypothetical protein